MKRIYKYSDFIIEKVLSKEEKQEVIDKFVDNTCEYLSIDKPKVEISYDPELSSEIKSFGYLDPDTGNILVVGINRNLADILRTIAHELVHTKQLLNGETNFDEDQANSLAGKIIRKFGLENNYIFE